jgi:catalase
MSQTPESMHMLVNLFSPRGIPPTTVTSRASA